MVTRCIPILTGDSQFNPGSLSTSYTVGKAVRTLVSLVKRHEDYFRSYRRCEFYQRR